MMVTKVLKKQALMSLIIVRDLRIVFLFELNLESNRSSDSFSNRIESAVYHASRNTANELFFFVRIESRIESVVRFDFKSNHRIESAVYHASRNTANGPQAYRTACYRPTIC